MKSIVNYPDETLKTKPFPKLMILEATGTIILAEKIIDKRPYGVVKKKKIEKAIYPVGTYTDWSENFVDFEGSITLSNQ